MTEIYVDGAGYNGKISRLCVYIDEKEHAVSTTSENWTNNVAEYKSVLAGIAIANRGDIVYTDSAVVFHQVQNNWKCNFEHLRILRDEVRKQLLIKGVRLTLIGGKMNKASEWLRKH